MLLAKRDPGPCPIDDCRHHGCTSEGCDESDARRVVVRESPPRRDEPRTPRAPQRLGTEPSPTAFTTASYRRVTRHGRW